MVRPSLLLAAGLVSVASAGLAAQAGRISYESFALPNGLRVVYAEDHSTPIVTVDLWYRVGSRNERPGRGGFAHLFEHLMFQGSAHVKKAEHFQLIERAGGSVNGSTHDDYTNYYETVPSNRLNLALWLEADRMRSLAITDENFHNQRETVKEERRLRVDNQPYGAAFTDGVVMAFDSASCFAYAHPTIGSMDDLNAAKLEDVQAFFDTYYAPNNAMLVVVGDFRPVELRRLVNAYFADVRSHATPPPVRCNWKVGPGERRRDVEDAHANPPAGPRYYRLPAGDDPPTPPLHGRPGRPRVLHIPPSLARPPAEEPTSELPSSPPRRFPAGGCGAPRPPGRGAETGGRAPAADGAMRGPPMQPSRPSSPPPAPRRTPPPTPPRSTAGGFACASSTPRRRSPG